MGSIRDACRENCARLRAEGGFEIRACNREVKRIALSDNGVMELSSQHESGSVHGDITQVSHDSVMSFPHLQAE